MAEITGSQHLEVNGNGVHGCDVVNGYYDNDELANGHLRKNSYGMPCQTKKDLTYPLSDHG